MDYRVKVKNTNPKRYIVQKKSFFGWFATSESDEDYYFSKEEAEQSIDDIKNWNDTKHYHRVTKGGRVYITTKDFFKQPRVKDQLKKLKESGIIEEIEKNNGRNRT